MTDQGFDHSDEPEIDDEQEPGPDDPDDRFAVHPVEAMDEQEARRAA